MRISHGARVRAATALAAVALLLAPSGSRAQLVQNGDFSTPGTSGQLTVNTTLANWTGIGKEGLFGSPTTPPVFVFAPGTGTLLSTTGVNGDAFMGNVKFYNVTTVPGGGNVVAADGDPDWGGGIQQTITGLTAGLGYTLSFNWAGAQQQGFSGATTEKWQVTFGSEVQSTATVNTPSQGFAGWQTASLNFTASSSSQLLTFLAVGTPGGQPPWLLLNGVSLTPTTAAVPEPSTWAMATIVGMGFVVSGIRERRRRARRPAA